MNDTEIERLERLERQLARIASKEGEFTPGQHANIANLLNGILQSFKQERTEFARIRTELVTREAAVQESESLQNGIAEIGKNTTEKLDKQTTSIDRVKDSLANIGENATVKGVNEKVTKIGETLDDIHKKVNSLDEDNKDIKENLTNIGETINDTHKKLSNLGHDIAIKGIDEKVAKIGDSKTFKDISKGVQGMEKTLGAMSEAMTGVVSSMSILTLDGIADKVKGVFPAPTDLSNVESAIQALTTTVNDKLMARPNDITRLQEQFDSLKTKNRELRQSKDLLIQQNETLWLKELLTKLLGTAEGRERVAQESKREWRTRALRAEDERQQYSSEASRLDQRLKEVQHQLAEVPILRAQLETARIQLAELDTELADAQHRPTMEEVRLATELVVAQHRPTQEEMELSVQLEETQNDLKNARADSATEIEKLKTELKDVKEQRDVYQREVEELKCETV